MSTVFTRIVDDTGAGVSGGQVVFRRRWSPQARVGAVTVTSDITVTADATGFITTALLGGEFRVWLPGADPRVITVPDDDGTYLLEDLLGVTGNVTPLTYRYRTATSGDNLLEVINASNGVYYGFRITGAEELQIQIDEEESGVANYRWEAGCLQIWHPDGETWHALYLTGGSPQFVIGDEGELYSANARHSGGKLQLRNSTTGLYHSVYLTGTPPTWAIAAGEA